jgi:hypothetical protein
VHRRWQNSAGTIEFNASRPSRGIRIRALNNVKILLSNSSDVEIFAPVYAPVYETAIEFSPARLQLAESILCGVSRRPPLRDYN